MKGISKGIDNTFIEEFMSLQTDNNNLCNVFYKKMEKIMNIII